jgi:hypothetical protein
MINQIPLLFIKNNKRKGIKTITKKDTNNTGTIIIVKGRGFLS